MFPFFLERACQWGFKGTYLGGRRIGGEVVGGEGAHSQKGVLQENLEDEESKCSISYPSLIQDYCCAARHAGATKLTRALTTLTSNGPCPGAQAQAHKAQLPSFTQQDADARVLS